MRAIKGIIIFSSLILGLGIASLMIMRNNNEEYSSKHIRRDSTERSEITTNAVVRDNASSSAEVKFASPLSVKKLVELLILKDGMWEEELQQYIGHYDSMPQNLFEELSFIASSTQTVKRIHIELKEPTPEQLAEIERKFQVYLKKREAQYPEIIPAPGMISISNALANAVTHYRGGYDASQKPKIELEGSVYKVTLWQYRRPILCQTGFAAIVDIDAWSGQVVNVLLSAD